MTVGRTLIRVQGLSKTYVEGKDAEGKAIEVKALQGVSLEIRAGEFIAVVGPNGSGKSTLINCLGAFERADGKENSPVQYQDDDGFKDVWENPELYRQNFVGIVFQDFHLLPRLRVGQNVELPLKLLQIRHYSGSAQDRLAKVERVLERLGIEKHLNRKVHQISGGERQRVAIARALVKEPCLLLADEPTGNLDERSKEAIVRQLRDLAAGELAVLMVTHDLRYARKYADRIVTLRDGRIDSDHSNSPEVTPGGCKAGRPESPGVSKKQKRKQGERSRRRFGLFFPRFSQSPAELVRYSLRDARESTVSLATNVFAIFLGTLLTAMLLALLAGTEAYVRHLVLTIPGIDSVHVWVDYSTGEEPMTRAELTALREGAGVETVVPSVNQFVTVFDKPTRETIVSLFSTQPGDPEVERLELVHGTLELDPAAWNVLLPMRTAEEINNFHPEGLVGKKITLQLRRYSKTVELENSEPAQVLDYPVKVMGIVESSPEDRVYGSLDMVRFVRDFSTGRSSYTPEPEGAIDLSRISARTINENVRVHFADPAEAETAFMEMKDTLGHRFDLSWPGARMLYLRDIQTVSKVVLVGIGLLAIVAGAVSIFNTLVASVARKTREIGILRALGVARLDIFVIFLGQSVVIGALACFAGLTLAGLAMGPLNHQVTERWEQLSEAMEATGGLFLFSMPLGFYLTTAVVAICLVAASLPSFRASSKSPMDALREL